MAKIVGVHTAGVPVGATKPFSGSTVPTNFLLCDGSAVSRTTYASLFAVIGTTHGSGDGSTTFNLPDLRGRAVAGKDDMGGTAANRLTSAGSGIIGTTLGNTGGSETHTLSTTQIPSHSHYNGMAKDNATPFVYGSTTTGMPGLSSSVTATTAAALTYQGLTSNTGSGSAHNNAQPTIVLNYIIAYK